MISSLCSGTALNPTLSVTAPPGTQFFNSSTKPVPLVYGNCFIEGMIISSLYSGFAPSGLGNSNAALWEAICVGKIKLNWILADSKIKLTPANLPYDPLKFNSGDPDVFEDEYPALWGRTPPETHTIPLPYLSPLHGIAHYYFSIESDLGFDPSRIFPKIQFDVTRLLNTRLSINLDNIPLPSYVPPVITDYLSFSFLWWGGGADTISVINGQQLKIDDRIVFLTPSSGSLPVPVQPNVVYWVVWAWYSAPFQTLKLSATKSGSPITFITPDARPYTLSLVLDRNAGNNPASVIWDLLVNPFYGLNLSAVVGAGNPDINVASFQAVHDFFYPHFPITVNVNSGQAVATVSLANAALFSAGQTFTIYGAANSEACTIQGVDTGTGEITMIGNFAHSYTVAEGACLSSADFCPKPYGVNCSFHDKASAREMMKKICEMTDCILTLDNDGKFYLTVNDPARLATSGRMGGTAGAPPVLSTDDFSSFSPTIKTFDDTINEFRGKYISFANSYAALEVFFRNEANIEATGIVRSKDFDLSAFIFPDIVSLRLQEIAKRESFPLITISATCGIALLTALVNDIFRITYPEYGIDDYFKITKKVPDAIDSARVKIEFSQCPELMFDLYSTGISQASPSVPSVAIPGGSLVVENLTFPAGTNLSTVRSVAYTTDADSIVVWGINQEATGALVYDPDPAFANNGDYTIISHNQIKLNPVTWANSIQSNVLGKLNVDSY